MLKEVKGGNGEDRAEFREDGGRKSERSTYKGQKSEGNFGKSAARRKFFEKIWWIENLSLCLQC